jgi:RsiW-degrading membrane proteinase PrsW (M82 family)
MPRDMPLLLSTLVGLLAFAWLGYFRWKDARQPEPLLLMLAVAGGGAGAALAALGLFAALEGGPLAVSWEALGGAGLGPAALAALRIGLVEEGLKLLAVAPLALRHRRFDEPLDGPVYAACAGLGFAAAESWALLLAGELAPLDSLARAAAAPLTHALLAAPAGWGLAAAVLRGSTLALPAGLAVSVAAHALYDLLLARPGVPPGAAAAVVLALWVWLLVMAPRLARPASPPRPPGAGGAGGAGGPGSPGAG